MTTTKTKLKQQGIARAGGVLDMSESSDEWDEDDEDYQYQDMVRRTALRNLIWMSKPMRLHLNLDVNAYEAKFEVEMLVKEGTYNIDGDGEEATTEVDADEDAVVEVSIPVDPSEQREIHKRDFYNLYQPYYKKTTNTHLITDSKYNEILCLLPTKAKASERGNTRKIRQTYQLVGNVENRCIYRKREKSYYM
jgi:hypothetical protein